MKNKIIIINGPNLEVLGTREPEIYGNQTLKDIKNKMDLIANENDYLLDFYQSNIEGELIDKINSINSGYGALIINPAAYTHTSVALYDSLKNLNILKIEVHISNIYKREEFRKKSLTAGACDSIISGFGIDGYILALNYIIKK